MQRSITVTLSIVPQHRHGVHLKILNSLESLPGHLYLPYPPARAAPPYLISARRPQYVIAFVGYPGHTGEVISEWDISVQ